jgi:steroid delta-isomerase-like uncharacterized protein
MNHKIRLLLLQLVLLASQATAQQQEDIIARNRQIGQRYFNEVWNKGNLDLLDTLLAPAYINHTPSAPTIPGPEGLKPIVRAIRKAFPDLHYEIGLVIATPEYVTMRVTMTGTQTDSLFGIPPTGKAIRVMQINIEKIENGRIAEHWRVTDELSMMKQIGVVK